jgi:CheY-like chemotaxis protein
MQKNPIVIVENDPDDQEIYEHAIKEAGIDNAIHFFDGGQQALDYLTTTTEQPFIIFSDINMPVMDGIRFREKIQNDPYLRQKGIPFVFISTNANKTVVAQAHALSVQGFFQKPNHMEEIKNMMQTIFYYWKLCKHINNT